MGLILVNLSATIIANRATRYVLSKEAMNYEDALDYCSAWQFKLVEIKNAAMNQEVNDLMASVTSPKRIWIGIKGVDSDWRFDSNNEPVNTFFWSPGQPQNVSNSDRCVEVTRKDSDIKNWYDAPCDHVNQFYCDRWKDEPIIK